VAGRPDALAVGASFTQTSTATIPHEQEIDSQFVTWLCRDQNSSEVTVSYNLFDSWSLADFLGTTINHG
jgi:hypothetical protein